jgi:hypothetical protein
LQKHSGNKIKEADRKNNQRKLLRTFVDPDNDPPRSSKSGQPANLRVISYSHLGCSLYPGFWWVKKHNKKFISQRDSDQPQIVAHHIIETKSSRLLTAVMHLELALGKWISYPFGIRCLMTCRRVS